jgi:hypothetical protein
MYIDIITFSLQSWGSSEAFMKIHAIGLSILIAILLAHHGIAQVAQAAGIVGPSCTSHSDCRDAGLFCKFGWCGNTTEGVPLPCGTCTSCKECTCNNHAIDEACPVACMSVSTASGWVKSLSGTFFAEDGACRISWTFEGFTFRQYTASIEGGVGRPCSPYQLGLRLGVFQLIPRPYFTTAELTYQHGGGNGCTQATVRLLSDCAGTIKLTWHPAPASTEDDPLANPCSRGASPSIDLVLAPPEWAPTLYTTPKQGAEMGGWWQGESDPVTCL